MANVRYVVDDQTIMDGELGQWALANPAEFGKLLKPNTSQDPWSMPVTFVITMYAAKNQDVAILVRTHTTGWTLTVES